MAVSRIWYFILCIGSLAIITKTAPHIDILCKLVGYPIKPHPLPRQPAQPGRLIHRGPLRMKVVYFLKSLIIHILFVLQTMFSGILGNF